MTSLPISQHQLNFAYFSQQLSWTQLFEQVINLERTPASCIARQPASTRKRKCLTAKPPLFDHLVKKDCLQWPAKGWSGHWLGCGLSQIPWPVRSIKACGRKLDCNYRPFFCLLAFSGRFHSLQFTAIFTFTSLVVGAVKWSLVISPRNEVFIKCGELFK